MNVTVTARHMDMTEALHTYVERKIVHALQRIYHNEAATLEVVLVDMAQAKRGGYMECNVHFEMPSASGHREHVVIHEQDAVMHEAIDRAHDRLLEQTKRHQAKIGDAAHRGKNAAQERAAIARQQLTSEIEPWEVEAREYERSAAHP